MFRDWYTAERSIQILNESVRPPKRIEYIRGEFTRKKCKTAILLYCFHTAGVLHIFMLYNLLGPGISFYRKLKLILKENQIMK